MALLQQTERDIVAESLQCWIACLVTKLLEMGARLLSGRAELGLRV